ncbi:MAG: response regulator [Proteobacteria bacterium]|nr:response regulator [Pseudomonadota bacterium]
MATLHRQDTALGAARARFLETLSRKAKELGDVARVLGEQPQSQTHLEEVRRRVHALYASAQIFDEPDLVLVLRRVLAMLDSAREDERALGAGEQRALSDLVATLMAPAEADASSARAIQAVEARPSGRAKKSPARQPARQQAGPPAPVSPQPRKASSQPKRPSAASWVRDASLQEVPAHGTEAHALTVLFVGDPELEHPLRRALPDESAELLIAPAADEGLRLAQAADPDLILLDARVVEQDDPQWVRKLRERPLLGAIPTVLVTASRDGARLARQAGAQGFIGRPPSGQQLADTVRGLVERGADAPDPLDEIVEATVDEIAQRVADTVRRGLASVDSGTDIRLSLGASSEIKAVAWSAIGRIRAHLTQHTGGKVRFQPPAGELPSVLSLAEDDSTPPAQARASRLRGRRVLVVDDDPAVVWFFTGVLREAGAVVVEASDGVSALQRIRAQRPDAVLSDILMPELDGFGLCRALKNDVELADLPVILLSWKEDFLQRMRDLRSGASGYLPKETGTAQIVAAVADVLRPRARLEAELRRSGEVRGRLQGLGVFMLLTTVARERPNASVVLRDAMQRVAVEIRAGALASLTRSCSSGGSRHGSAALQALVGMKSGRFLVRSNDSSVPRVFEQGLADTLHSGSVHLNGMLETLAPGSLERVEQIAFEPETLAGARGGFPAPLQAALDRLAQGDQPRRLLMEGRVTDQGLASALRGLALRSVVIDVVMLPGTSEPAAEQREPGTSEPASEQREPGTSEPASEQREPVACEPAAAPATPAVGRARPASEADWVSAPRSAPSERLRASAKLRQLEDPQAGAGPANKRANNAAGVPVTLGSVAPSALRRQSAAGVADAPGARQANEGGLASQQRGSSLRFALLLAACALLGFVTVRMWHTGVMGDLWRRFESGPAGSDALSDPELPEPELPEPELASERPRSSPAPVSAAQVPVPGSVAPKEPTQTPVPAGLARELPFIDHGRGVTVAADQGLLVVEAGGANLGAELRIGKQVLGRPPVQVALPEGRHELMFEDGAEASFRYVVIRRGHTRIVQAP